MIMVIICKRVDLQTGGERTADMASNPDEYSIETSVMQVSKSNMQSFFVLQPSGTYHFDV